MQACKHISGCIRPHKRQFRTSQHFKRQFALINHNIVDQITQTFFLGGNFWTSSFEIRFLDLHRVKRLFFKFDYMRFVSEKSGGLIISAHFFCKKLTNGTKLNVDECWKNILPKKKGSVLGNILIWFFHHSSKTHFLPFIKKNYKRMWVFTKKPSIIKEKKNFYSM